MAGRDDEEGRGKGKQAGRPRAPSLSEVDSGWGASAPPAARPSVPPPPPRPAAPKPARPVSPRTVPLGTGQPAPPVVPSRKSLPPPPPPAAAAPKAAPVEVAEPAAELGPWAEPYAQLMREAEAHAASRPEQAAWLAVAAARIAMDVAAELPRADAALSRAAAMAPSRREVAWSRRSLAELSGKLVEVRTHARAELERAQSPAERVDLLARLAVLEELGGGTADMAESLLKEAVAVDASDLTSLLALAGIYARHARWAEAVDSWEKIASHVADPQVQAAWLVAAGTAREALLSDTAAARSALERAVAVEPSDVFARAALEPMLQRAEAWQDYGRVLLEHGQQLESDPAAAALLYERSGDALWEAGRDAAAAARSYELAAAASAEPGGPLLKLAEVLEARGDSERLQKVYDSLLSHARDPLLRASVFFKLGALAEAAGNTDAALAALQSSLEAMPTFAPAAESLEALCVRLERWDLLVSLLETQAERVASPAQRASRYVRIADLYGGKMGDLKQAIAWCERALGLDPNQLLAFDLLDRILRGRGELDAVATLYEHAAEAAKDPKLARALRLELASLHLSAGRAQKAAVLLQGALGDHDELPVLLQLARAHAESGNWAELVAVLEAQARLLTNPATVVAALYRIAVLVETRLGDAGRALVAYGRVLERAADHQGALEGLLRLRVQQKAWQEAVQLERKLAEQAARPEEAAARLHRAGWLLEARLGRTDEAIGAHEAAVATSQGYVPAVLALERALRAADQPHRLAAMYEARAAAEKQPEARVAALLRAAAVYELRMGDTQKALQAIERALTASPGCEPALWARLRIHEVLCDWRACSADLRALLGVPGQAATRAGMLARASRLHEFRLQEGNRASIFVEEAMASGLARRFLVADRLRSALGSGPLPSAHRWLAEAAGQSLDRRWAAAVCRLRLFGLLFTAAPLEQVEEACTRTLAHRPDDAQALEALASVLLRRRELAGAVPVLVRGARHNEHKASRALQLLVAGALAEGRGDRAAALDCYQESLAARADNLPALQGLRRLTVAAADWQGAVQAAELVAGLCVDGANRAEAWLDAGDMHLKRLKAPDKALAAYQAVLEHERSHAAAFERAASVLEAHERWPALAEHMAEHLAALGEGPRRFELLRRRAAVLADKLGRIHDAILELDKAARATPAPEVLSALAALYERDRQWQNAIQGWQRVAAVASEPAQRHAALLKQATLLAEQLGEHQQALGILEPLVAQPCEGQVARDALLRLAEVHAHLGHGKAARELFRQLGSSGEADDRVAALLSEAAIAEQDPSDRNSGQEAIERALELALAAPAVLPTIEAYFQQTGAWQRYVTLADRVADRAAAGSPGKLALRISVARIYRGKLRAPELADMHLRATVEQFPASTEPRLALGFGLVGINDAMALAELRAAVQVDPFCAEAFQAIASICHRTGLPGCAAYAATAAAMLSGEAQEVAGAGALEPAAGALGPDEALALVVGPTKARGMRRLAAALDGQVHTVFPVGPEVSAALARVGDAYPAAVGVRAVAAALGARPVIVYRGTQRAVTVLITEQRGIVFGAEQLAGPGFSQGMFEASWMLACVAAGSSVLYGLSRNQCMAMFAAAVETNGGQVDPEFRKKMIGALPRRTRKELERITEEEAIDLRALYPVWEAEERSRALRLAVVLTRDLRVAARSLSPKLVQARGKQEARAAVAGNELLGDALRFCVSDACWTAHARLFGRK